MWLIVVLLGVVIILYASMLPKTPNRAASVPDDFLDSVGDTLQHFADEIEEENKELLRMVGDMKREHEQRTTTLLARIEQLEKRADAPQMTAAPPSAESQAKAVAAPEAVPAMEPAVPEALPKASEYRPRATVPTSPSKDEPFAERTSTKPIPEASAETPAAPSRFANTVKERYRELFEMYENGKSIEFIAKKLGKNKGEVQLIIGLAKQEEPTHGQS